MAPVLAYSRSTGHLDRRWIELGMWAGMGLGLALCYLPTLPTAGLGLLLLGSLAFARPELALLLVPLTAPLFLTHLRVPSLQQPLALPPHELALLASLAAVLPHLLSRMGSRLKRARAERSCGLARLGRIAARHAPEALLLIAGLVGMAMAVPEPEAHSDALRAFRWFIAEPLVFVALIRLHARWPIGARTGALPLAQRLIAVFVIGGAAAALLGLLQFASYVLHAQIEPATFAAGAGMLGSIRRVTSVYGNPNNLALYIGRVWPLAAALALAARERHAPDWLVRGYWLCVLLCLGALLLSLSRGAWLGAGAALMVLLIPASQVWFGGRRWPIALIAGAIVVAVGALIFALRGGLLDGSADVRILFWKESIQLLERRPFGLGLDQFFYYHHPAYGRSLIDPALANTQERYARQPHMLIFEIWFNLGPLGATAFAWLVARCLGRASQEARSPVAPAAALLARGVLAALAAALVHGMVDSFYFWPDIAIAFWLLVSVSELLAQGAHSRADQSIIGQ
jgi:putative inorganic carbon (hco3(-)) transporter